MGDAAQARRRGARADRRRAPEAPRGRRKRGRSRGRPRPGREGLRAGAAERRGDRDELASELATARASLDGPLPRASQRPREGQSPKREAALAEVARRLTGGRARSKPRPTGASPPPSSAPPKPKRAPSEAHETAVRLETEIEERVMEGTVEVRREAEERVRKLVEKVEGEARGGGPRPRRGAAAGGVRRASAQQAEQREERVRARPPRTRSRRAPSAPGARPWRRRERDRARPGLRREASRLGRRLPHLLGAPPVVIRPLKAGPAAPEQHQRMREVRIRDTLSGELVGARSRPRRSASTPAGRPSTAASTSATPARSSSSRCLARFLRSEGYERKAGRQRHRHQRQDLRRGTRGRGAVGRVRRADDRAPTSRTPTGSGLGRPDAEPLATETIGGIVALIADLVESGHAYESGRRRLLPGPQLRRLRQALQPPPRGHGPGRGGGLGLAEGGPARLRALEGPQGGRGHQLGLALGAGPARLAHRVLGDGRGRAGRRRSRSTAAARIWSSPTTRTRSPSPRRRGARSPGSGCTTG